MVAQLFQLPEMATLSWAALKLPRAVCTDMSTWNVQALVLALAMDIVAHNQINPASSLLFIGGIFGYS